MIILVKLNLYQNKYQKIILGWTSPLIFKKKKKKKKKKFNW